jgi:hypothetical protein
LPIDALNGGMLASDAVLFKQIGQWCPPDPNRAMEKKRRLGQSLSQRGDDDPGILSDEQYLDRIGRLPKHLQEKFSLTAQAGEGTAVVEMIAQQKDLPSVKPRGTVEYERKDDATEDEEKKIDDGGDDEKGDDDVLDASGRIWQRPSVTERFGLDFVAEASCILHDILIQEYVFQALGTVADAARTPIIHDGMRNALNQFLQKRVNIEFDDNGEFRRVAFEHGIPLGARALTRRGMYCEAGVGKQSSSDTGAVIRLARANAPPTTLFQTELGERSAMKFDKLTENMPVQILGDPQHELHALFTLYFFSFLFSHKSKVSFASMYYVAHYELEDAIQHPRGVLVSDKRNGVDMRPQVLWLRRRWVVRDIDHSDPEKRRHWYECRDVKDAILMWLLLMQKYYRGELENSKTIDDLLELVK